MGLLDDAIREHLELKRQHGANPDDVSRQEREALGAARRAEFARASKDAAPADVDEHAEALAEPEPVAEESAGTPREPVAEEGAGTPREPVAEEGAASPRGPFDVEAAEPQAPEPPVAPPPRDDDPWLEDVRDEVPADELLDRPRVAGDEPREDVLEETPEFLQETPEHERLWFEQRPPRDFDWDK